MATVKHPKTVSERLPYLVQRLKKTFSGEGRKGVDRYFSMDYMGSAEFEYGSLPAALRAMRAAVPLPEPVEIKATRDGQPVSGWYVGDPAHLDVASYWFSGLIASDDARMSFFMNESANVYEAYGTDTLPATRARQEARRNYHKDILGWWCVDDSRTWAIFTTKEHAHNWLLGLTGC